MDTNRNPAPDALVRCCRKLLDEVDRHPRLGWYIAIITTANFLIQLHDLFH